MPYQADIEGGVGHKLEGSKCTAHSFLNQIARLGRLQELKPLELAKATEEELEQKTNI